MLKKLIKKIRKYFSTGSKSNQVKVNSKTCDHKYKKHWNRKLKQYELLCLKCGSSKTYKRGDAI